MEKNHFLQEEPVWRHKRKITLNAWSWTESHILNTLRNHTLKQGSNSRTFFSPCYIKDGNRLPGERTHWRIQKSQEHEVNKKRHGWVNERSKDSVEEEETPLLFCFAIYFWDKLVSIHEWVAIPATLNPSLGSSRRGRTKQYHQHPALLESAWRLVHHRGQEVQVLNCPFLFRPKLSFWKTQLKLNVPF